MQDRRWFVKRLAFMSNSVENRGLFWARTALFGYALLWLVASFAWIYESGNMAYVLDETPKFTGMSLELANRIRGFQLESFDIVLSAPPALCIPSALLTLLGLPEHYSYFAVQAILVLAIVWGSERVGTYLHGPWCGIVCAAVALSCPVLNSNVRLFTPDILAGSAMIWELYAFLRLRDSGGWRYRLLFVAMMLLLLNKGTGALYALPLWVCAFILFVRQGRSRGELDIRTWNRWEWAFALSGPVLLLGGLMLGLRAVTAVLIAALVILVAGHYRRFLCPLVQLLTCCGQIAAMGGIYLLYWFREEDLSSYLHVTSSREGFPEVHSWSDAVGRLFIDYVDHVTNEVIFPHLALLLLLGVVSAVFWRTLRRDLGLLLLVVVPGQIFNVLFFNYVTPRYATVWWGTAAVIVGAFVCQLWRPLRCATLAMLVFFQLFMVGGWMLGSGLPPANNNYTHTDYFMCGRFHVKPSEYHPEGAGWSWLLHTFNGQHHWADTYLCTLYPLRCPDAEKLARCWQAWNCHEICLNGRVFVCSNANEFEYPAYECLRRDSAVCSDMQSGTYMVQSACSIELARQIFLATHYQLFTHLILSMDIPDYFPADRQLERMEAAIRRLGPKWEVLCFSPAAAGEGAFILCFNGVKRVCSPWSMLSGEEAESIRLSFPMDTYYSERRLRGKLPVL